MLKNLFGGKPPAPAEPAPYDPRIIAGFLVESARGDGHYPAAEKGLIDRVLMVEFKMEAQRAAGYRGQAEEAEIVTEDGRKFSRLAKDFTPAQKSALMQSLWRAVLVDREKDYWENKFVQRAAKLLHVSPAESKRALKTVERSLRKKR